MATGKRYYWIKMSETFLTSDVVDYMMCQPHGAECVVLYQMLILKTINTAGRLENTIGSVTIPFDVAKIQRECRYFDVETIEHALELYKMLGLITDDHGAMVIVDHNKMVGSETDYASQKRNSLQASVENLHTAPVENLHTDIRDKSIENRDKSIESRYIESVEEREKSIDTQSDMCIVGHPFGQPDVTEIINYLNAKLGTDYKASTGKTKRLIHARLEEGFTVDDFKTVIDKKSEQWLHEPEMTRYLRPDTLFSNKFEGYLNEIRGNPGGLEGVRSWLRQQQNSS